jgi:hypothetical protein
MRKCGLNMWSKKDSSVNVMSPSPSRSQEQAQLGLGQSPGTTSATKRIVSPPSGYGTISITLEPSLSLRLNPRKRKASALTPDNANAVLSSCFDISGFTKRLQADPEIVLDESILFAAMKDSVKDSEVCKFWHCYPWIRFFVFFVGCQLL